jgi:DNA-binding MarR family transcriptional regulator
MRRSQKSDGALKTQDLGWSLLTPHAQVLLCIARAPDTRMREIAETVGISERGAHQIVADLVTAKYVQRTRVGRRNHYAIEDKTLLRHTPVRHRRIASIIALLGPEPAAALRQSPRATANGRTNGRSRRVSSTDVTKPSRRRAA